MADKQPQPIRHLAIAPFDRIFPEEDACCVSCWLPLARVYTLPALRRGGQASGSHKAATEMVGATGIEPVTPPV